MTKVDFEIAKSVINSMTLSETERQIRLGALVTTYRNNHELNSAPSNSKQIKCPGCPKGTYCNAYYCLDCERCWEHHRTGKEVTNETSTVK